MAIVCQKCGAIGYADLLVYCCLCHKAAEHQYCLDNISNLDEDIEWLCEDCTFKANKLEYVVNGQGLETSDDDVYLSSKKNIVSSKKACVDDLNVAHILHKSQNDANLHVHGHHEIKGWGKIGRRSMKHIVETHNDPLRDGVTNSQPFECSKPNRRRRKLILPDEDGDSIDGIKKDYLLGSQDHDIKAWGKIDGRSMKQQLECSKFNDHRRKLILPDEDDDLINDIAKDLSLEDKINSLRRMISLHRSFGKNKLYDCTRKHALFDKENEDNNRETGLLKETIVCLENNTLKDINNKLVLQKMDDEMTTKTKSEGDLAKRLSDLSTKVHLRDSVGAHREFYDMLAMHVSWRGWFKICGRAYGPLIAHLSPKAGEKAWNATGSLPRIIQLTTVSRSRAWPRSFKISPPTDDNIALIFFPPDSRVEKMIDQLVQEVIRCDLMLKVALDRAELLVFPSNLLPENYRRYQDKYYLWGVFKRKDSDKNTAEIRMPETNENSTKQTVYNSPIKSEEVERERDDEEMSLEGDQPQEMDNDQETNKELNGCLELFPTRVENIALKVNTGDGKKGVDLELVLGLPFRQ